MSPIHISWRSICSKPLSSFLNLLLIAFGTGILTILLLASSQISDKLENNSKDIDLVVGAKGSPLQLILSSIYHIDFPTGNIPLKEAQSLMQNPWVKRVVPLALGDNYNGVRIVGTDTNFVNLYQLKLDKGRIWHADFEAIIGSAVAREQHLKVGDPFYGAHGLSGGSDIHKAKAYRITGILQPKGNVTDNLILTKVSSIWKMHDAHHEGEDHDHANESSAENEHQEITSLLIQYRSPMAVAIFPRMVNESTKMQAASPAQESTRLFSLIGVGVDTLQWFAILIMFIAAVSVFVNLYNSLKDRSYDLAIMRTLGASRGKLFLIVITEGIVLTVTGALVGIALGHTALGLISHFQESSQAKFSALYFLKAEVYLLISGLLLGILASIIPSWQAYNVNISGTLSKN
jgi:putative ABC transport system permease protein